MNKVMQLGRLTADPKEINTTTGNAMCSFSLAVRRPFTNENSQVNTDFFNCVAFSGCANLILRNVKKGDLLLCYGYLRTQHWKDSIGTNRHSIEIVVTEVGFSGKRNGVGTEMSPPDDFYMARAEEYGRREAENENSNRHYGSESSYRDRMLDIPNIEDDDDDLPF